MHMREILKQKGLRNILLELTEAIEEENTDNNSYITEVIQYLNITRHNYDNRYPGDRAAYCCGIKGHPKGECILAPEKNRCPDCKVGP